MKNLAKRIVFVIVVLGLIGVAGAWYVRRAEKPAVSYRTAPVKRGDLAATIGATGTVEPEEVVDVGAQVAGKINNFGKDKNNNTVDYGSSVEEGTILAQIDDSLYTADVAQAAAEMQQAQAGVKLAEANLEQLKAKLYQAQRDWDRAQKLGPSEALAQATYDAYQSAYETAKANVVVGEATIVQSKAAVAQAEASSQRVQRNLGYCTIKSPVKGVIIDRRVNIGQTVVSSLNAPSLFLIAKDLKRMQVWAPVNEVDIANIRPGLAVTFTVDAYPGEVFHGEVGKVRLNATMTQNVVTYTVEVVTDNSSGKLLPYLTANVEFELARHTGVLMVPNAALHWSPAADRVAPELRAASAGGMQRGGVAGNEQSPPLGPGGQAATGNHNEGVVWVQQGDYVRPVPVRVGLSDDITTEIESDQLQEGTQVVVGEQRQASSGANPANPFIPQMRRGGRGAGRAG